MADFGCCCAEDLQACAQAMVDQLVGFRTLAEGSVFDVTVDMVFLHSEKALAFLQVQLDEYATNHGRIDEKHMLAAELELSKAMI